jgi:hypothetical protein
MEEAGYVLAAAVGESAEVTKLLATLNVQSIVP